MKYYKRYYDNPNKADGTAKPNELLGDFTVVETLVEGGYESIRIAKNEDENPVLMIEHEVTGYIGGSRLEVLNIEKLIFNEKA